jgi:Bacterial Ig-like domain
LRKIAAVALAIPILASMFFSSVFRRSGSLRLLLMAGSVGVIVAGLLAGLPAEQVAGTGSPTFAPLVPQGEALGTDSSLALDAPYRVQFTKPMNEGSVEGALALNPKADVLFKWDATAQILSLVPNPHWLPSTHYEVTIGAGATDQEGLSLAQPLMGTFDSGLPTSGIITATQMVDSLVSPGTAFQLTFTRPVKLGTVLAGFGISPHVPVTIVGDDPTDLASQVFTMTPTDGLASQTAYAVTMSGNGVDVSGSPLQTVAALVVETMEAPAVMKFRPLGGTISYDGNQPVSVRFSVPMDRKSTAAAFSVTVGGRAVAGNIGWVENDTVIVLTPRYSFKVGSTVVAKVSNAARAVSGLHIGAAVSVTFTIQKPRSTGIQGGGGPIAGSQWYGSEVYYFNLMNCTRTGGWVTSGGACSSETHHTLPSQGRLTLSAGISNKVSRPFAKYMADRGILNHYAYHDPHWRLCNWGGYCGGSWAENIASPSSAGSGGMIAIEIFYQNEYWCRCEHYYNIMAPFLSTAGVGVYVSGGVVRVSIDFYG